MAKTVSQVSITTMDKIMKENFPSSVVRSWHGVDITIKRTIGLSDAIAFVNSVAESCFGEDGSFIPELKDIAVKGNIVSRFSNISLPSNTEHTYELLYGTDIVDFICAEINAKQISELVNAANEKISYFCSTDTTRVHKQLEDMVEMFENLKDSVSGLLSEISPEDIQSVVKAIGNGGIDEEKLVDAYVGKMKEVEN